MGCDELCVLCGIRPYAGPSEVYPNDPTARAKLVEDMATEIAPGESQLARADIARILDDALQAVSPPKLRWLYGLGALSAWCPRSEFLLGHDCLAIGYFGDTGAYEPLVVNGHRLHPTGDRVTLLTVCEEESGTFLALVEKTPDGRRVVRTGYVNCMTGQNIGNFNIFVHEACFGYLQAWLTPTHPPRLSRGGEPLSLAGELYELVNSRKLPPVVCVGTLPAIDYGSMIRTRTNEEWGQWQDYFMAGRDGSRHTTRAIQRGFRRTDLVPALLEDFNCWMFVRPDAWPQYIHPIAPPNILTSLTPPDEALYPALATLPSELYPEILLHLELPAVVALASTCRAVRARVLEPPTLAHGLRRAICDRDGVMHWILPVPSEDTVALQAMRSWLVNDDNKSVESDTGASGRRETALELLLDSAFALLAFVRACYSCDSMRARRRRWGIIKQFDVLWTAYRRDGWERDEFVPADVDFALP